jgi:hypothetical protein
MDTMQAVPTPTDGLVAETGPPHPTAGPGLTIRLKAERVQEPQAAEAGGNVTYLYEFACNQLQPVTIEVPLVVVNFHGLAAWGTPGGPTTALPARAGRSR